MDPDDSIIARAVLFLLYYEEIADLLFSDIGTKYRGDTIFTPGNLIGKSESLLNKKNNCTFWDKQIIDPNSVCALQKKISVFISKYHTFPNFFLLPNKK